MLDSLPPARKILETTAKCLPLLRACLLEAISNYDALSPEQRARHTERTEANFILDNFAYLVQTRHPELRFIKKHEDWVECAGFGIRMKKLSEDGRPSNNRTPRSKRVTTQRPVEEVPNIRLNFGWCRTIDGVKTLVSQSTGLDTVAWCYDVQDDGVYEHGQMILPFTDAPSVVPPVDKFDASKGSDVGTRTKVRPRREATDPGVQEEKRRIVKPPTNTVENTEIKKDRRNE